LPSMMTLPESSCSPKIVENEIISVARAVRKAEAVMKKGRTLEKNQRKCSTKPFGGIRKSLSVNDGKRGW